MKRRRSLRVRLLVLSMAAAICPTLIISAIYQSISSRELLKSIELRQTEMARRVAEEINNEVRQAQNLVAILAKSSFFSAGSRAEQYEALRNLLQSNSAFQETMLTNASGTELLNVNPNGTTVRFMKRFEGLHGTYIGLPFFSGNRAPTILLGEPVRTFANPRLSGAVLAKMSFTKLGEVLRQTSVGTQSLAFVVDSKGTLLAHPDENLVYAHTSLASRPAVHAWLLNPGSSTGLINDPGQNGQELLSIAYPIPLLKSSVVIQQRRSDVYAPLRNMRRQLILWTLISAAVFLLIALALSWRILKPLQELQSAVEQVGKGKRDVHLNIHTHDELEELAKTFEKMTRSLSDLERMRRDLISMIVHDLKMPLSTILPSLESLLLGDLGKLNHDQSEFVSMARRSAHEMLMLIQNILDVARLEEGKLSLHREIFNTSDWAKSVLSNFKPLAESARKRLTLILARDLAPLEGDAALLGRVLGNLISNALRYTAAGSGEVIVTLYRDGPQLAVEVKDNGEGIPESEQANIFEKFVQGGARRESLGGSVGLGLTFCKMVVEAHGGRLTLFSKPKTGSVFTFRLAMTEPAVSPIPVAVP